jgi:predicted tellurium resistance membrane protein TerC
VTALMDPEFWARLVGIMRSDISLACDNAFVIALSLPLVVLGSGLLADLMARHEWIVWLGGGVLGYVAGEMMANDPIVERWLGHAADAADQWLSVVLGAFVLGLAWWLGRSAARLGYERRRV